MANAKTHFSNLNYALANFNSAAATYLMGVDPSLCVTSYFLGQNFGHATSNVVESTNNLSEEERELLILETRHPTMFQRFKRYETGCTLLGKKTKY